MKDFLTIAQSFADDCQGKTSWGACLNVLDENGFSQATLSASANIVHFHDGSLAVFRDGACRSYSQD